MDTVPSHHTNRTTSARPEIDRRRCGHRPSGGFTSPGARTSRHRWLVSGGIFLLLVCRAAALTVAPIFTDGVVLQAHQPLPVWGTAEPGETVRVEVFGQREQAVAGSDGQWRVTLAPLDYAPDHGAVVMAVRGKAEVVIRDVRVGEVWVVVGPQSIREWQRQEGSMAGAEANTGRPTAETIRLLRPDSGDRWKWVSTDSEEREQISATGYYFAEHLRQHLGRPIGLIDLSDPGASVLSYLADEDTEDPMMAPEARARAHELRPPSAERRGYQRLKRLAPFATRGVIWAQADADLAHADVYAEWLTALVVRWRAEFEDLHLPFVLMQLPAAARGEEWVAMRAAQGTAASLLLDTSVAITVDVGDCDAAPYAQPRDLAERLGRLARSRIYQEEVPGVGAIFAGRPQREAGRIILQLFNAGEGAAAEEGVLRHFEVEDANGQWHPTDAVLRGPRELIVEIPDGVEVRALRHGWRACYEHQVRSLDGRPLAPFRLSFAPPQVTGPERWRATIDAYRRQDRLRPPPSDGVVFVGSSSIRLWSSLRRDFPGLETINRGFGGSIAAEANHYFDEVVRPYQPRTIVFYSGENDVAGGRAASEVLAAFEEFCRRTREALPDARILFLSLKPSPFRWEVWPKMVETNRMIADYCARDERAEYVDVASPLLDQTGVVRPELFTDDALHLNAAGYEQWTAVLRGRLRPARD